jgi:hypothetical protein
MAKGNSAASSNAGLSGYMNGGTNQQKDQQMAGYNGNTGFNNSMNSAIAPTNYQSSMSGGMIGGTSPYASGPPSNTITSNANTGFNPGNASNSISNYFNGVGAGVAGTGNVDTGGQLSNGISQPPSFSGGELAVGSNPISMPYGSGIGPSDNMSIIQKLMQMRGQANNG